MQLTTKELTPIWIAKTRSFWLGMVPALLTLVDVLFLAAQGDAASMPVAKSVTWLIGLVLPVTADQVHSWMVQLAPLYALIVAHARRGVNRPYASTPGQAAAAPVTIAVKGVPHGEATQAAKGAVQGVAVALHEGRGAIAENSP